MLKQPQLDKTDLAILRILQENARTPLKVISERTFVSAPTVAARIQSLEKMGVLTGYHAEVNNKLLGNTVRSFINLEVNPSRKAELYPFLEKTRNVLACDHVTGEYSLLIETIFEDTDALNKFIGMLQEFGRTKTQIVFSTVVPHRGFIDEK